MTEQEARIETIQLFGLSSFTEEGDGQFYVGELPTIPGPYTGYMGKSWEEALDLARRYTEEEPTSKGSLATDGRGTIK